MMPNQIAVSNIGILFSAQYSSVLLPMDSYYGIILCGFPQ